ncbi:helix-turn-helix domain-containing protein [Vibrio sinaloensis]|uniref:helix-turn-helix domain-containing protein n=1 Tax=Photobacterium sp. (strain ATCC 43367) TaxID=379097 RepID=UPI00204B3064|nr:helix-turn-helix domain-containing protein [Vibrio sinaloensis]UPQ90246.1 helix-turn-helix domain-containing protein [Vibrio sinaloensis]
MTPRYRLRSHQRYQHLNFAFVDGDHRTDFAMHKHDFSELFLVLEGEGKHLVSEYQYPLCAGDIFVINGDTEHGFKDVRNLKLINLMFDDSAPFFELPSMRALSGYQALFKIEPIARQTSEYSAKLTLDRQQLQVTAHLLEQIRQEYQQAEPGFEIVISSLMQQLVVNLSRIYQSHQLNAPQTTFALSRALVFLEQHFTSSDIDIDQIANAAFVSPRQLQRLFRQYFECSPIQYLRSLQLNYASKLITDEKVTSVQEIAERSGFSDSNYFSKCYKQHFAQTPRDEIKKAAQ